MTLKYFFTSPCVELPKDRGRCLDKPFNEYLHETFSAYIAALDDLDDDLECCKIKAARPDIENLAEGLEESVSNYLKGFPHAAYESLRKAITGVEIPLSYLRLTVGPEDSRRNREPLYRIRPGKLVAFTREDLFHVPFQLRHLIRSQRYSISGLPSLYLSGSLWSCWEEMQRPDFHEIQVSHFRYSQPVEILDFGFTPAAIAVLPMRDAHKKIDGYIRCWPLIAACSVRVLDAGSPFVPEYIIPQLLLQWLRNEQKLDGLRYFSTKIPQPEHYPSAAMNYVFPVQEQAARGSARSSEKSFASRRPVLGPH